MKYVDEFRNPSQALAIVAAIRNLATRPWTLMEVCGGQTHSLLRHGIEEELADCVEFIHGPGCPVCVTAKESIDLAVDLCRRPGNLVTSFGDMLRVPGSKQSLMQARAEGGQVRIVYSPLDAVRIAQENPKQQVIFFAVGFETTAPATALAVLQAHRLGLGNFCLLCTHVRVLPAMEQVACSPDNRVQAFMAAGHVCTVTGFDCYTAFAKRFRMPVVVTGFEPVDLLTGIHEAVHQLETGQANVANRYGRTVRPEGNVHAQQVVEAVFEVCDRPWRGLGVIPGGGLRLGPAWSALDAETRFAFPQTQGALPLLPEATDCQAGAVLTGRLRPPDCPHFGTGCTPETPLGAPMVSSEGACSAYFKYGPRTPAVTRQGGSFQNE